MRYSLKYLSCGEISTSRPTKRCTGQRGLPHGSSPRCSVTSTLGVRMRMRQYSIIIILTAALLSGCDQNKVSLAKKQHREFVGTKPESVDIVGTYILSDQTVIPGGLSALAGRKCQFNIFADGTFSVTNYPECAGARSSKLKQYKTFHSTTGTWKLETVGTSYGYGPDPKNCWGLQFQSLDSKIDSTAFTGPEPPYGLLTILGDPDSNNTLRFKRKD